MKRHRFFVLLVTILATALVHAQTYTVLYNLGSNPGDPVNPPAISVFAQGRDGNLYSTTQRGGANDEGAIFQLTPSGTMRVLHSFDQATGRLPLAGLTLGSDGNLYGTTISGGVFNNGVVFKISTTGNYTVMHDMDANNGDGFDSEAPPVQGRDGNYYGTVKQTGIGFGAIYKMTPSGSFTTIHTFSSNLDGSGPTALVLGTDGNFYGTAHFGGANDKGTFFKVTPQGTFTVLHSFTGTDGTEPYGPIIQASDGNFYGTTFTGGQYNGGVVYKVTSAGVLTDLYQFGSAIEFGLFPVAGLVQATNGKLYGSTEAWGTAFGTLYQITPTGVLTVVFDFDLTNGAVPEVSMIQHTNGALFGDTGGGGSVNGGVLYKFSVGAKAFVSLVPYSGKVGSTIGFLGQGFTGTTVVSFNGTPGSFTVKSNTFLTAVVPAGATSGLVTVSTSSGNLTSNRKFLVHP